MNMKPTNKKFVLVIDDEPAVCEAVSDVLETLDVPVLTAVTVHEGIRLFQTYHPDIALIILDVQMPVVNGLDALQWLRAIDPDVHVILSSGSWSSNSQISDLHVDGFLPKPYSMNQITTLVTPVLSSPAH